MAQDKYSSLNKLTDCSLSTPAQGLKSALRQLRRVAEEPIASS
jgi:hypothetical protein